MPLDFLTQRIVGKLGQALVIIGPQELHQVLQDRYRLGGARWRQPVHRLGKFEQQLASAGECMIVRAVGIRAARRPHDAGMTRAARVRLPSDAGRRRTIGGYTRAETAGAIGSGSCWPAIGDGIGLRMCRLRLRRLLRLRP